MSERWDELTGDSDIPAWDALSEDQREDLEAMGYGLLSYPHYVERYKKWYGQPNATYSLYEYFSKLRDENFGGHGSDHIEHEFEDRAERAHLQAELTAANARAQAAEARLAQIAELCADYPSNRDARFIISNIEAIARGDAP